MKKMALYAITINIILSLLFAYTSIVMGDLFSGNNPVHTTVVSAHWSFPYVYIAYFNTSSVMGVEAGHTYVNYPYVLFWVVVALNLIFILLISRDSMRSRQRTLELPKN